MIRLRALVSAADAAALWDLRCLVRERLVAWIWDNQRASLPRVRADLNPPRVEAAAPHAPAREQREEDARVFSGDAAADARGAVFVGPEPAPGAVSDSPRAED